MTGTISDWTTEEVIIELCEANAEFARVFNTIEALNRASK